MRYIFTSLLFALPMFAEGPEFEVAVIKPFDMQAVISAGGRLGPSGGGPGTNDPTHLAIPLMTLKNALMTAFDLKNYQVIGPDTLNEDRFSFAMVLPEGATKDDVKIMWRNLLISRFGLKYHTEQREFQVDELVIGPKGHKLVENNEPTPEPVKPGDGPPPPPAPPKMVDGRPVLTGPGTMSMGKITPNGIIETMIARAQTIDGLVTRLAGQAGHPVVDKTGLKGKYDYTLEYAGNTRVTAEITAALRSAQVAAGVTPPPASTEPAEPGMEIGAALQQQLGLRLVKGKGMLDVVVVDKIERTPTEN